MEPITLITPTGMRPEAFALCEKYIQRQTYQGSIQWIVVDDSMPKTKTTCGQEVYNAPKQWREGINTQRLNLDFALSKVRTEYVFIIEDDDWYHPEYLERMMQVLSSKWPVAGEGNAKYYYLPHKSYKEMRNYEHASLCQTGVHKSALYVLERAINSGEIYIDVSLWKQTKAEKLGHILFLNSNLAVGLKGLPGRKGIGVGHTPVGYVSDPYLIQLKRWIGKDVDYYLPFMDNNKNVVLEGKQ